jgi:hypothetical protein
MGSRSRGALAALVAAVAAIAVVALPATASARDRNHDRIPDRWEKRFHLSLKVNQAHRDQDRDGLNNRQEFKGGTNPRKADTDEDGVPDDEEISGTIASFDGTTLTIDLATGGTVSGMVTDATAITCETADTGDDDSGDGSGGGDGKVARHDGGDAGDDGEATCTTADLVPGAAVDEAELDDAGTTFTQVDLGGAEDDD